MKIINILNNLYHKIIAINIIGKVIIILLIIFTIYQYFHNKVILEDQQKNFMSYLYDLQDEYQNVESAMSALESEIDDFDYEDWRNNVPDVQNSAYDLESQISDFSTSITNYSYRDVRIR